MNYRKALEIAEMCRPDEYGDDHPPTNPVVLLEAARVIYIEEGTSPKVKAVIAWLAHIMAICNVSQWASIFGYAKQPSWLEE